MEEFVQRSAGTTEGEKLVVKPSRRWKGTTEIDVG